MNVHWSRWWQVVHIGIDGWMNGWLGSFNRDGWTKTCSCLLKFQLQALYLTARPLRVILLHT